MLDTDALELAAAAALGMVASLCAGIKCLNDAARASATTDNGSWSKQISNAGEATPLVGDGSGVGRAAMCRVLTAAIQ
jgi:hypothetical protein